MMTKERVGELDRLISEAIADGEKLGNLVDNHVLEFWRGAKMIVDELKIEIGSQDEEPPLHNAINQRLLSVT